MDLYKHRWYTHTSPSWRLMFVIHKKMHINTTKATSRILLIVQSKVSAPTRQPKSQGLPLSMHCRSLTFVVFRDWVLQALQSLFFSLVCHPKIALRKHSSSLKCIENSHQTRRASHRIVYQIKEWVVQCQWRKKETCNGYLQLNIPRNTITKTLSN